MAYYLQTNGTSDWLQLPSMTFTKIELDTYVEHKTGVYQVYVDGRTGAQYGNFQRRDNNVDEWADSLTSVSVDGVIGVNNTAFVPSNQRVNLELIYDQAFTDNVAIFRFHSANIYHVKGRIYSIKVWNGAALQAHYDMSTQTVNDQSGNGNHATLTGGTWVDDGTGGDPGTDVSYAYTTKQSIYADRNVEAQTKQVIYTDRQYANPTKQAVYADRQAEFPTLQAVFNDTALSYAMEQTIYADRQTDFPTVQTVYADRSWDYPMLQQIFSDYVLFSASFPLLQIIYADRSTIAATKQVVWSDVEYDYSMLQRIIDPDKTIIGHIKLDGERVLYVYLVGERELTVSLEGGIDLKTNQNFSMVSGDTRLIDIPIAGVDLSGASAVKWILHAYGNIKVSKDLTAGITVTDAAAGTVQIKLEPADTALLTGIFSHEMQVTDAVGNVSTVMSGKVTVEKGYIV